MESPTSAAISKESILSHPRVFRIGDLGQCGGAASEEIHTGFDTLDQELAGGGWARPGLTEILCNHTGIGELSLLMKGLGSNVNVTRPGDAMNMLWVVLQEQSWIPYAPALAQCGISLEHLAIVRTKNTDDALWAVEQGLKSGACRAVLLRMKETYCSPLSLRRLLQAAIAGRTAALLIRPLAAASSPSPAGTRIALRPEANGVLRIELLKQRGLPPGRSLSVRTREMACLQREPAIVRDTKSAKPSMENTAPHWLENIVSGTVSHQVRLRTRMLDPNRR